MAWGSSIETVYRCPVAVKTVGVLVIPPAIIGALAGAVEDKWEWLALFRGRTEQNGLVGIVEELLVPEMQIRDGSTCSIDERLMAPEDRVGIIGVVHSHHSMSAKFSPTDLGKGGLCTQYPISLVISTTYPYNNKALLEEAQAFGFAYELVMRPRADCGAYLKVHGKIVPEGYDDWLYGTEPEIPARSANGDYNLVAPDLEDCQRFSLGGDSDRYYRQRIGNCGCVETTKHIRKMIFGRNGDDIIDALPEPDIKPPKNNKSHAGYNAVSKGGQQMKLLGPVKDSENINPYDEGPTDEELSKWKQILDDADAYDAIAAADTLETPIITAEIVAKYKEKNESQ